MDKKYFLITFVVGTGVILVSIFVIFIFNTRSAEDPGHTGATAPTPYPVFQGKLLKKNVPYNPEDQKKTIDIIENRPELSEQGKYVRQGIIARLNNNSGIVHETSSYRLEYVKLPDTFMAEIFTLDVNKAKQEADLFLKEQGFSSHDICYLPLVFYLNSSIMKTFSETNQEFSPLPIDC